MTILDLPRERLLSKTTTEIIAFPMCSINTLVKESIVKNQKEIKRENVLFHTSVKKKETAVCANQPSGRKRPAFVNVNSIK